MEGILYYFLIISPIHAHELGDELVENLAGYNGSIQNVYIDNKISVKNTKVPVDKTIYENVDDLSKYLMPILANKQKKCKLSKWIESDYAKKVGRYKKDSKGKYYKLK